MLYDLCDARDRQISVREIVSIKYIQQIYTDCIA